MDLFYQRIPSFILILWGSVSLREIISLFSSIIIQNSYICTPQVLFSIPNIYSNKKCFWWKLSIITPFFTLPSPLVVNTCVYTHQYKASNSTINNTKNINMRFSHAKMLHVLKFPEHEIYDRASLTWDLKM